MYAALARAVLDEAVARRAASDIERLRRRHPRASKDELAERLIRRAALQCASAGALLTGPAAFFGAMPFGADLAWQVVALNRLVLGLAALYGRRPSARDRAAGVAAAAGAGIGSEVIRQGLVRVLRRAAPRGSAARTALGALAGGALGYGAALAIGRYAKQAFAAGGCSRRSAGRCDEPRRRRGRRRRRADRLRARGRARAAGSRGRRRRARRAGAARPRARRPECCRRRPKRPSRRRSSTSRSRAGSSIRTGRGSSSKRSASTSVYRRTGLLRVVPEDGEPAVRALLLPGSGRGAFARRSSRARRSTPGSSRSPGGRCAFVRVLSRRGGGRSAASDPRGLAPGASGGACGFSRTTAVRRFSVERGACRGVETDGGPIEARLVVDAAGAWAAFDSSLPVPVPVEPVRGQIVEVRLPGRPLETVLSSRGGLRRSEARRNGAPGIDARARRVPKRGHRRRRRAPARGRRAPLPGGRLGPLRDGLGRAAAGDPGRMASSGGIRRSRASSSRPVTSATGFSWRRRRPGTWPTC